MNTIDLVAVGFVLVPAVLGAAIAVVYGWSRPDTRKDLSWRKEPTLTRRDQ